MNIRAIVCIVAFCIPIQPEVLLAADAENVNSIEVSITSGGLSGLVENDIAVFRGIPYAAPPVGPLRWAPTASVDSWDGARDATKFSAPCSQPDTNTSEQTVDPSNPPWVFESEGVFAALNVNTLEGSSEDCLYLNVWAPAENLETENLPVMVWFHGGAGSASDPFFDGTNFAQKGIVLVTFNRRMSMLGNFSHPALTKEASSDQPLGNYSRLDQLEALRWVNSNIESFGGDPNNITLFGQSAGGAAIIGLLATKQSEGLFHKAIVQSSSGFWGTLTHEQHERLGSELVSQAGLDGSEATVEELRNLPIDELPWGTGTATDGRWWVESKTDAVEAGRIIDIPLIIGWNSYDGSSLRFSGEEMLSNTPASIRKLYEEQGLEGEDLVYAIYTDRRNGGPAKWLASNTASGSPSYLYQFSYVLSIARRFVRGAEHGRDVIHVFDNWLKTPASVMPNIESLLREEDLAMSKTIQECWVNFARYSVPSCANTPVWNSYNDESEEVMIFDTTNRLESNFRKNELDAQIDSMQNTILNRKNDFEKLLQNLQGI